MFVPELCELTILEARHPRNPPPPHTKDPLRSADPAFLESAAACLTAWPWFPDQYRSVMKASDLDWLPPARRILQSAPPQHRARLAEVARDLPELISVVPEMLTDPDPHVVNAGSQGLLDLATQSLTDRDLDLARATASALHTAMGSFDAHRQRTVIEVLWQLLESPAWTASLGRPGAGLLEWFRTSKAASRSAARSVLRTGQQPWLRARAIAWLAEPAAQSAAIDRLARAESDHDHATTLKNIHLLSRPARARVIPMLGPGIKPVRATRPGSNPTGPKPKPVRRVIPGGPIPTRTQVQHLSGRQARSLPHWLSLLQLDPADLALVSEPLLVSVDPRARHALARTLDESRVRDLLFDPDARVARHAAYRWSLAGVNTRSAADPCAADASRLQQARQLTRAPSALIRKVAAEQTLRFEPLAWSHPMARVQARKRHLKDPIGFTDLLRTGLESTDATHQLDAAQAALSLGLGAPLTEPLSAVILEHKPHDLVASVAIRALVRTHEVDRQIIRAALDHPDARVRANTIEELARSKTRQPEASLWAGWEEAKPDHWIHDRAHRLRAAAVRASLAEPKLAAAGRSALLAMLSDDLAMHRVSGAWLACRARVIDAAGRLRDLALEDPDHSVRARADWALRRLASPAMRTLTRTLS